MTKPISVFVCGRQRPESCESPDCGQTSVATCDYPLRGKKAGKNCGKRPFSNKPVRGILVELPIKTKSLNKGVFSRAGAMAQHAENAAHRDRARAETLRMMGLAKLTAKDLLPAKVTLTRISAGKLDGHDNVRGALKRVVDGICKALGVDDGDEESVIFEYAQRQGPRGKHKVEVLIARREP
jgi:hypothetical protein